jgi:hypothetical protein
MVKVWVPPVEVVAGVRVVRVYDPSRVGMYERVCLCVGLGAGPLGSCLCGGCGACELWCECGGCGVCMDVNGY